MNVNLALACSQFVPRSCKSGNGRRRRLCHLTPLSVLCYAYIWTTQEHRRGYPGSYLVLGTVRRQLGTYLLDLTVRVTHLSIRVLTVDPTLISNRRHMPLASGARYSPCLAVCRFNFRYLMLSLLGA